MAYKHGIDIVENPTSLTPPITADSAVQVVVGTAPVHLSENISGVVNQPVLAYSLAEAQRKLGYSDDFNAYTLCESMYASFQLAAVAPIIFINVLDPVVHKTAISAKAVSLANGEGIVEDSGVLLDTLLVKSGASTLIKDVDYLVSFNSYGKPVIVKLSDTLADDASLTVDYDKLDPSLVTAEDIIGGYDAVSKSYKGLELLKVIYPKFNVVAGTILAPGFSHLPEVGAVLQAKTKKINGSFNAIALLDLDTTAVTSYDEAQAWKNSNSYNSTHAVALWPKVKVGVKQIHYSALMGAVMAMVDARNDSVPHESPSNEVVAISGAVLADGTEVYLDQAEANHLNGVGVTTLLNWNGWKTWGNNTAAYPNTTDPKDRYVAIRRIFNWWGNTFILSYFNKVDDPTNTRLIESIVDAENIRANGYAARGQIAGARMEFRSDMNPTTDLLDGKIVFVQRLAGFLPAEHITNILEFDPQMLTSAIFGGAS